MENSEAILNLTSNDLKTIEGIAAFDEFQVEFWKKKKALAEKKLEYWERCLDNSLALSKRLSFNPENINISLKSKDTIKAVFVEDATFLTAQDIKAVKDRIK